jgi:membrane associated rhomboid family serine protease
MGSFITDLKNSFNKGNIYIQFIYINVGVFIVTSLLGILWMLFNRNGAFVLQYLELPAWTLQFVKQPWSLLTYMFMHAGILHLLFNMLWLYWFGQMFLSLFSAKHFRGLYLLGGICGGLLYMIAYNVFPYFSDSLYYSYLLGASASVLLLDDIVTTGTTLKAAVKVLKAAGVARVYVAVVARQPSRSKK